MWCHLWNSPIFYSLKNSKYGINTKYVTFVVSVVSVNIIHQMFLPAHNWLNCITRIHLKFDWRWEKGHVCLFTKSYLRTLKIKHPQTVNCSQKKISSIHCKNIWRVIKMIASIWHENILVYLSLDIIVPQSSQFSSSFILSELFTSQNRKCLQTSVLAYFQSE